MLLLAAAVQATYPLGYGFNGIYGYSAAHPYNHYGYGYAPYSASQYRTQDEFGQASYGYSHPGQAASNFQDAWGNQVGSYAYISPEGKEIRVSYVADANGFRVVSNALPEGPSALPVPVEDTPEVIAATKAHLAAIADAKSGVVAVSSLQPVEDTAEVAAAKKEHAEAHQKALAAASASRKKRSVLAPLSPLAYSYAAHYATAYAAPYAAPYAGLLATPYAAPYAGVYAAPAATPVREAVLTKTVLNPGHAVAYRVD